MAIDATDIVDRLMPDFSTHLCSSDDEVVNQIATTNALGWAPDTHEILYADPDPMNETQIRWSAIVYLVGEQVHDKSPNGDRFAVTVRGTVHQVDEADWEIYDYMIEDIESNMVY